MVERTAATRPHRTATTRRSRPAARCARRGPASAACSAPRPGELLERQRQADRLLDAEGAGHLVHELTYERAGMPHVQERPGGPVLRVEDRPPRAGRGGSTRSRSCSGTTSSRRSPPACAQRMRLLEALLADLYGPRTLVRDGVVPARVLFGVAGDAHVGGGPDPAALDRALRGRPRPHRGRIVAGRAGPRRRAGGLGYALLNRSRDGARGARRVRQSAVAPIAEFATVLRQALAAQAPAGRRSPRIVVLTGGPPHPTYVEHSYLATQMGFHLAEGGDLVVRQNRLWLRALDGLEPIDVVYRRVEDAALDPLEPHIRGANGVPAITWAAHAGGVGARERVRGAGRRGAADRSDMPAIAQALLGEPLRIDPLERRARRWRPCRPTPARRSTRSCPDTWCCGCRRSPARTGSP